MGSLTAAVAVVLETKINRWRSRGEVKHQTKESTIKMIKTKTVKTDFVVKHEGRDIYVEISPCSWMHPGYGLQIQIASKPNACNAESVFDRDQTVDASVIESRDLVLRAKRQARKWLKVNGVAELDAKIAKWAEASVKFDAAIKKEQEKEAKARIKRLTKRQTEGYTHVVDAWIHPAAGDDYRTEACTKGEPTPADIQRILSRSQVKTDYKVTPIVELLKMDGYFLAA